MVYAVAGVLIAIIVAWSFRANELFCISARKGRLLLVRGRAPQSLLSAFRDVLTRADAARATIRARRDKAGARLSISGITDVGVKQQLRNVFHLYPISNLRAAPRSTNRTLGQILGIVWLAWLLDRFSSES